MGTGILGYGLGDSRDEELCGVGCFLLGYTQEYTLCQITSLPSLLSLAGLAKAPLLRAAGRWPE